MEAECVLTAALNGMVLQSWEGKLTIFPSVPESCKDVSFENLPAQGGIPVSVEMVDSKIILSLTSPKGGNSGVVVPWAT